MALNILEGEIPAIVKMCNLPDEAVEQLIGALSSSRSVADHEEMAAQIVERVPSIQAEDLRTILDTLYSLYYIRNTSEVRETKFLADLIQGIRDSKNSDLEIAAKDVPRLRRRFKKLLSIPAINVISKAVTLERDGEHLYCGAKILSDIRPFFGDDVADRPAAGVVTHTPKLTYHEEGEHKTFFLVLDRLDLENLQKTVERAQAKDTTLRVLLKDAKVSELGI